MRKQLLEFLAKAKKKKKRSNQLPCSPSQNRIEGETEKTEKAEKTVSEEEISSIPREKNFSNYSILVLKWASLVI